MKYAVFFRNLNLGRANCPSRAQLEQAFIAAGAGSAESFLTNGTLVFSLQPGHRPRQVLATACAALRASCGLKEPGFIRRLDDLAGLVRNNPFSAVAPDSFYQCCITFLHDGMLQLPAVPLESARRDVAVLRFTDSEALSLSRKVGNTPGSPNAFLEKLLGTAATTRSWNTVVRLVQRYA